ncbi:FKBP-type peptidyl-prolyl cis-trans isomerase [Demequina sp.]|uniref:FKBP-type peptidyl-prolyl cis-trans isomerase n=1 Tax=Demequina sp. TaxID=2050685 RepID=UPI003D0C845B
MRRRALALVAAVALTLAGCSEAGNEATSGGPAAASIDDIEIGTSDALAPSITLPEGETFTEPQGTVIWDGEGAALVDNQPLLLDVYGVSLADGSELINTFDGLPRSFVLAREVLGDDLYDLLIDSNVGTRVLAVAPATEDNGELTPQTPTKGQPSVPNVAMVVDVLSDRAVGAEMPQRDDLPTVAVNEDTGEPTVTIPEKLDAPTTVQSETTILGDGPQISEGAYLLLNYKAVRWKNGTEFASSWPTDTAPFSTQIGTGQLVPALDDALLDQTVGSQVLVVAPPAYGYPDEGTLVFVVDILDIWTPVE